MMDDAQWLAMAQQTAEKSGPALIEIAEHAAERHGAGALVICKEDAIRVSLILGEIQDQSYMLGVIDGIRLALKVAGIEAPPSVKM